MKYTLLVLLLISTSVVANDRKGKVCFGKNLAKALSEHSDRLFLTIDDSDKLYFNRPHDGTVVENLDTDKTHRVIVYFDEQAVLSWPLNFSKLKAQSVIIWRASGSWRMEPAEISTCK